MAQPGQRVLRLPRTDRGGDSFVLLNVTSAGSCYLDLKLVGTDGESVYVASIEHRRISKLRTSNYDGPMVEWEDALTKTLLGHVIEAAHRSALADLECVASVSSGSELTIVWRRHIKGITQRLGSLSLQQTDDEEIELFDWTGIAASTAVTAQDEVTRLDAKLKEQQEAVSKLNQQLEDLIKAKSEHEDALLQKFASLINSKKLKIRDQQRLLATAKVDDAAAKEVAQARETTASPDKRRAGPSRKGKRKANGKAEQSDDESEDGFEAMRIDAEEKAEREEGLCEAVTPDPTDNETESENGESTPPPLKKSVRGTIGGKGKAPQEKKATETQGGPSKGKEKEQEVEAPPPRRELPFAQKAAKGGSDSDTKKPQPSASVMVVDDDETEDEL